MVNINRRVFLKTAAVAGAGAALPSFSIRVQGAQIKDRINHASFGASGMAWADINSLTLNDRVNLVAVCEVDATRLGNVKENFPGARIYSDWRELLEKEHTHLDSVNVSTPDHMHAPIAVTAMNLGLHVYGQKPLGHEVYECRRMAEIARKSGLITQMGIQLASTFNERFVEAIIHAGTIGKVREVHTFSHKRWGDMSPKPDTEDPVPAGLDWEQWCGVGPKARYINGYYHPGQWRRRLPYGTGTLGDMGCHIYSPMYRSIGVGAPLTITSTGAQPNQDNWAVDCSFEYVFAGTEYTDGKTVRVTWYDGAKRPPQAVADLVGGTLPDQGNVFIGTEGALLAPHEDRPRLFPEEKFAEFRFPKLDARDHYQDFVNAVRGEDVQPIADFHRYAGPLTETILLGGISSHFPNQTLEWDAKALRFTNNQQANQHLRRTYRTGWEVDGLSIPAQAAGPGPSRSMRSA